MATFLCSRCGKPTYFRGGYTKRREIRCSQCKAINMINKDRVMGAKHGRKEHGLD